MKTGLSAALVILLWFVFSSSSSHAADFLGDAIDRGLPKLQKLIELPQGSATVQGLDEPTIVSGLRESLSLGTKNAVGLVSRPDGYFGNDAIRIILAGNNRAATDYFQSKTTAQLYDAFKPTVAASMNQVGVTRAYRTMLGKIPALSLVKPDYVDLDQYVTQKALDGLFRMIAEEEAKIRTDPLARTTDLLKKVFAK